MTSLIVTSPSPLSPSLRPPLGLVEKRSTVGGRGRMRGLGSRRVERLGALVAELEAIVANAGIDLYGGILERTDEQLKSTMDTNVAGFRVAQMTLLQRS